MEKKKTKKRFYSRKPKEQLAIAKERIKKLFAEAQSAFKKDPAKADRYVHLARKIAMKYKVKLTSSQKRKFCKHCYSFLMPSVNCRVRLADKKIVYYCLNCRKYTRIPYKTKKYSNKK